jgi:hypothetical protein
MIINVYPNEFQIQEILEIRNKLKNGEKLENVFNKEQFEKNISLRQLKDKLDGTHDLDGVNLWYNQACIVNEKFPYVNTIEFCSAYRLEVKTISITELLLMDEYDKKIILAHLEEIIKDIVIMPEDHETICITKESDKDSYSIRLRASKPPISLNDHKQTTLEFIKQGKDEFVKLFMSSGADNNEAEDFWNELIDDARGWGIDVDNLLKNKE